MLFPSGAAPAAPDGIVPGTSGPAVEGAPGAADVAAVGTPSSQESAAFLTELLSVLEDIDAPRVVPDSAPSGTAPAGESEASATTEAAGFPDALPWPEATTVPVPLPVRPGRGEHAAGNAEEQEASEAKDRNKAGDDLNAVVVCLPPAVNPVDAQARPPVESGDPLSRDGGAVPETAAKTAPASASLQPEAPVPPTEKNSASAQAVPSAADPADDDETVTDTSLSRATERSQDSVREQEPSSNGRTLTSAAADGAQQPREIADRRSNTSSPPGERAATEAGATPERAIPSGRAEQQTHAAARGAADQATPQRSNSSASGPVPGPQRHDDLSHAVASARSAIAEAVPQTTVVSTKADVPTVPDEAPAVGESALPEQNRQNAGQAAEAGAFTLPATDDGRPAFRRDGEDRQDSRERRGEEWARRALSIESRLAPPPGFLLTHAEAGTSGGVQHRAAEAFGARLPFEMPQPAENLSRLIQSVRVQTREGISQANVRLNPEHLGEVTVTVKVDGGTVTAIVRAESADVRQWLRGQEEALRTSLAEQGLELDDLVVDKDPSGGREQSQGEENARSWRTPSRRRSTPDASFEITV